MPRFRTKVLVAAAWLAGCGGAMCLPPPETSASFSGFDFHEVTLDSDNAGCSGAPCIVNHFQGRVSCPYDGASYCACPAGFTCSQFYASVELPLNRRVARAEGAAML